MTSRRELITLLGGAAAWPLAAAALGAAILLPRGATAASEQVLYSFCPQSGFYVCVSPEKIESGNSVRASYTRVSQRPKYPLGLSGSVSTG